MWICHFQRGFKGSCFFWLCTLTLRAATSKSELWWVTCYSLISPVWYYLLLPITKQTPVIITNNVTTIICISFSTATYLSFLSLSLPPQRRPYLALSPWQPANPWTENFLTTNRRTVPVAHTHTHKQILTRSSTLVFTGMTYLTTNTLPCTSVVIKLLNILRVLGEDLNMLSLFWVNSICVYFIYACVLNCMPMFTFVDNR